MELTDIHNRRANIELVSKRAKEHGYPLLVWPEDKELLRLDDLPVMQGESEPNTPVNWWSIKWQSVCKLANDIELRAHVRDGFAYIREGRNVHEYAITTRPVKL